MLSREAINTNFISYIVNEVMYWPFNRLPETCWEVVSHSDWQTWRSCQTEKYFAGPKKKAPKNSRSCA